MIIDEDIVTIGKCCFHSEGSVVAHFWLILSLPESHAGKVTMQKVNESLLETMQSFRETGVKDTVSLEGYLLLLSSFSITGNCIKILRTPPHIPLQCSVYSYSIFQIQSFSATHSTVFVFFNCVLFIFICFAFAETQPKVIDFLQASFGMTLLVLFSAILFYACLI